VSITAIRIEKLSKQYRIGQRERYKALRDVLAGAMSAPFRFVASSVGERRSANGALPTATGARDNFIWALKDISFDLKQGEVVGIIGPNGSGKTTLLKIISRITEPTKGYAEIRGRVGALLEVGTGFHPELTGRENVYLNGAILGMKRAEIERKFDEIVAFAEVEKFIDTPMKRYSSGMQVRLAFAVAAHLEPEILLVDEVLAVGDTAFQRKCLGKMGSVAQEGRTVLFVSHNMGAIASLTKSCLRLRAGSLIERGETGVVVSNYLAEISRQVGAEGLADLSVRSDRVGQQDVLLRSVRLFNSAGEQIGIFQDREPIKIEIDFRVNIPINSLLLWYQVRTMDGATILLQSSSGIKEGRFDRGDYRIGSVMDPNHLRPGMYSLELKIHGPNLNLLDGIPNAIRFSIVSTGATVDKGIPENKQGGFFYFNYEWSEIAYL
jgi:lipopolysaccharide transport system ATP-binding protein